jgi:hypothetical protein
LLDQLHPGGFLAGLRLAHLKSLKNVRTQDETHFYRCARHGTIILPADGRIRQDDPLNSAARP